MITAWSGGALTIRASMFGSEMISMAMAPKRTSHHFQRSSLGLQEANAHFYPDSSHAKSLDPATAQRAAQRLFQPPRIGFQVRCPYCGAPHAAPPGFDEPLGFVCNRCGSTVTLEPPRSSNSQRLARCFAPATIKTLAADDPEDDLEWHEFPKGEEPRVLTGFSSVCKEGHDQCPGHGEYGGSKKSSAVALATRRFLWLRLRKSPARTPVQFATLVNMATECRRRDSVQVYG